MREGRLSRCSRNVRPEKDGEGAARCPSCSQSPHDETVVARCAQDRAALATPLNRGRGDQKALVGRAPIRITHSPSPRK